MTFQLFGLVLDGPSDTCAGPVEDFRQAEAGAAVAALGAAPRLGSTPVEVAA